ncbi:hypothetical protein J7E50_20805 [Pedobacter sp. ISL-68]|uniref:hypothetical protein n=1 Tax=unclassified Pedobacter TaxID=2628915 RepID=UPI001BE9F3A4|nr:MULTISPECIES: hypothetical protein [unclassified Pedobacter]MBT2563923.1 hypothetical protein [Pedobacter sp. ISL-64]MBT2592671.1 hypothetical protein [Pedobacter sp. ISL-68]
MQNNNCKNPNTKLPNQVAAVSEFRKLIEAYFDMISLSDVNQLLTQMLSACTGPDPRLGKHKPITISNALYDVNNIIKLFTKTKPLANDDAFQQYAQNQAYQLQAVGHFDVEHLSELLYYGLNAYIFQEEDYEGASLNFSAEITAAYKMIFDWFTDCDAWRNSFERDECNETIGLAATL